MTGGRLGMPRHLFREVDSTQTIARDLARAGAPEGTLVVAEHQRAGRGRAGRVWVDHPGENLLCSLVLRPGLAPARVPQLALMGAVAIAEAVEQTTGARAGIKWPNDLLLGRRKFCGVLAEAASDGETVAVAILGIGVNVNQRRFPADLAARATSLALELGHAVDRSILLEAVLARLDYWYDAYVRCGFATVRPEWARRNVLAGQPIVSGGVAGVAIGIDEEGALLVRSAAGDTCRVVAGEVALDAAGR
jgi:BirA family biotin operon repressor/biotin-[acetyl-CoA-carboxylase] ligase